MWSSDSSKKTVHPTARNATRSDGRGRERSRKMIQSLTLAAKSKDYKPFGEGFQRSSQLNAPCRSSLPPLLSVQQQIPALSLQVSLAEVTHVFVVASLARLSSISPSGSFSLPMYCLRRESVLHSWNPSGGGRCQSDLFSQRNQVIITWGNHVAHDTDQSTLCIMTKRGSRQKGIYCCSSRTECQVSRADSALTWCTRRQTRRAYPRRTRTPAPHPRFDAMRREGHECRRGLFDSG